MGRRECRITEENPKKIDDSDGMCSTDMDYEPCWHRMCSSNRRSFTRSVLKGLLVLLGLGIITTIIFLVCYFLLNDIEKKEEEVVDNFLKDFSFAPSISRHSPENAVDNYKFKSPSPAFERINSRTGNVRNREGIRERIGENVPIEDSLTGDNIDENIIIEENLNNLNEESASSGLPKESKDIVREDAGAIGEIKIPKIEAKPEQINEAKTDVMPKSPLDPQVIPFPSDLDATEYNTDVIENEETCQPLHLTLCSNSMPWSITSYPNVIGDVNEAEAEISSNYFQNVLLEPSCSSRGLEYICAVLQPPCGPDGKPLPPCRIFCEDVVSSCLDYLAEGERENLAFDCQRFPNSTNPNVCLDVFKGITGASDRTTEEPPVKINFEKATVIKETVTPLNINSMRNTPSEFSVEQIKPVVKENKNSPKNLEPNEGFIDQKNEETPVSVRDEISTSPSITVEETVSSIALKTPKDEPQTADQGGVFICDHSKFLCVDGSDCLDYSKTCDGVQHCLDNSDETFNCTPSTPSSCDKDHFSCTTTFFCIPSAWVCDGSDDCKDNSDEKNCSDNNVDKERDHTPPIPKLPITDFTVKELSPFEGIREDVSTESVNIFNHSERFSDPNVLLANFDKFAGGPERNFGAEVLNPDIRNAGKEEINKDIENSNDNTKTIETKSPILLNENKGKDKERVRVSDGKRRRLVRLKGLRRNRLRTGATKPVKEIEKVNEQQEEGDVEDEKPNPLRTSVGHSNFKIKRRRRPTRVRLPTNRLNEQAEKKANPDEIRSTEIKKDEQGNTRITNRLRTRLPKPSNFESLKKKDSEFRESSKRPSLVRRRPSNRRRKPSLLEHKKTGAEARETHENVLNNVPSSNAQPITVPEQIVPLIEEDQEVKNDNEENNEAVRVISEDQLIFAKNEADDHQFASLQPNKSNQEFQNHGGIASQSIQHTSSLGSPNNNGHHFPNSEYYSNTEIQSNIDNTYLSLKDSNNYEEMSQVGVQNQDPTNTDNETPYKYSSSSLDEGVSQHSLDNIESHQQFNNIPYEHNFANLYQDNNRNQEEYQNSQTVYTDILPHSQEPVIPQNEHYLDQNSYVQNTNNYGSHASLAENTEDSFNYLNAPKNNEPITYENNSPQIVQHTVQDDSTPYQEDKHNIQEESNYYSPVNEYFPHQTHGQYKHYQHSEQTPELPNPESYPLNNYQTNPQYETLVQHHVNADDSSNVYGTGFHHFKTNNSPNQEFQLSQQGSSTNNQNYYYNPNEGDERQATQYTGQGYGVRQVPTIKQRPENEHAYDHPYPYNNGYLSSVPRRNGYHMY